MVCNCLLFIPAFFTLIYFFILDGQIIYFITFYQEVTELRSVNFSLIDVG